MIILYFQLCYGISFCLLESNDKGERNLRATLYDYSEQFIRPRRGFIESSVAQTSWRRTNRVRGVEATTRRQVSSNGRSVSA